MTSEHVCYTFKRLVGEEQVIEQVSLAARLRTWIRKVDCSNLGRDTF
jgi:hypothetical protein